MNNFIRLISNTRTHLSLLGRSQVLVPNTFEIKGKNNKVTNAVVVTKNKDANDIYFTTSSTRFDLTNALYEIATKGSGRVYKYNPEKNVSEGKLRILCLYSKKAIIIE